MRATDRIELELKDKYKDWDGVKQFDGLSERLIRMVEELFWTPEKIEIEVKKCFKSTFPESYSEMLVEGPITIYIFCPHHLVPCKLIVFIGYIPQGPVLGLSKFTRVADILSKRPIIQEQYSRELAEVLTENLKAEGVGVYIEGQHGCMQARGIRQPDVSVSTTTLLGSFLKESSVKQEFYDMMKLRRK